MFREIYIFLGVGAAEKYLIKKYHVIKLLKVADKIQFLKQNGFITYITYYMQYTCHSIVMENIQGFFCVM